MLRKLKEECDKASLQMNIKKLNKKQQAPNLKDFEIEDSAIKN